MYERSEDASSNNEEYGSGQTYCGPATMMAEMAQYFHTRKESDAKIPRKQPNPIIEVSAGFLPKPDPFTVPVAGEA
jgi:hypothetical protein